MKGIFNFCTELYVLWCLLAKYLWLGEVFPSCLCAFFSLLLQFVFFVNLIHWVISSLLWSLIRSDYSNTVVLTATLTSPHFFSFCRILHRLLLLLIILIVYLHHLNIWGFAQLTLMLLDFVTTIIFCVIIIFGTVNTGGLFILVLFGLFEFCFFVAFAGGIGRQMLTSVLCDIFLDLCIV